MKKLRLFSLYFVIFSFIPKYTFLVDPDLNTYPPLPSSAKHSVTLDTYGPYPFQISYTYKISPTGELAAFTGYNYIDGGIYNLMGSYRKTLVITKFSLLSLGIGEGILISPDVMEGMIGAIETEIPLSLSIVIPDTNIFLWSCLKYGFIFWGDSARLGVLEGGIGYYPAHGIKILTRMNYPTIASIRKDSSSTAMVSRGDIYISFSAGYSW